MSKLLLVDGNNIAIRQYHAMKSLELSNSKGVPTGAIYGFINVLARYVREQQPSHLIVVFDRGHSYYRRDLLSSYKRGRNRADEDLRDQMSHISEFLQYAGIAQLGVLGVEADDILAALTIEYVSCQEDGEVVLVSADHDMRQLVSEFVTVIKPGVGKRVPEVVYNLEKVKSEYGVEPTLLPDIWALMGDSTDNIPGIPGYGWKTAKKAIEKYEDVYGVMDSGDFEEYEDMIRRNYALIQLDGVRGLDKLEEDLFSFQSTSCEKLYEMQEGVCEACGRPLGEPIPRELVEFMETLELSSQLKRLREGRLWK